MSRHSHSSSVSIKRLSRRSPSTETSGPLVTRDKCQTRTNKNGAFPDNIIALISRRLRPRVTDRLDTEGHAMFTCAGRHLTDKTELDDFMGERSWRFYFINTQTQTHGRRCLVSGRSCALKGRFIRDRASTMRLFATAFEREKMKRVHR